jgi:serine/threonine protein kinase
MINKIVYNTGYKQYNDFVQSIPERFDKEGKVIYKQRNEIRVFDVDNELINVKKFRTPNFFNRIVYTFFRKSKAFKTYRNTLRISEKGFETAVAIACIEIKKGGLLCDSYFISLQCHDVKEIREYYYGPLQGNERLIDAFAGYTAALHDADIYHLDYSPGNILIREDKGKYTFIPVDVNRMKFMPVGIRKGCLNFARLFEDNDIYERIGNVYSQSRAMTFSPDIAVSLIIKYKDRFLRRKAGKVRLKKMFKMKTGK